MHIGVVIPAYNVAPWLAQAIRSVQAQTYRDWSMVIIDDGSTDATAEIAAAFADPRIRLIRQRNEGVSAARNRGITETKADALLFLDGDDWLAPDAMAELADTLDDAPWAVAAVAPYARVGVDGTTTRKPAPRSGPMLRRLLVRNLFANGGHLLIRQEAIEAAGDFDVTLPYGEDWEYWTRIALLGEFMPTRTRRPMLFVRDRPNGACMTMATDPGRFTAILDRIYTSSAVVSRLDAAYLRRQRQRAEAETAWVIGRELIRHDFAMEGRGWLLRSVMEAPTLKRSLLLAMSWMQLGQFRSYRTRTISAAVANDTTPAPGSGPAGMPHADTANIATSADARRETVRVDWLPA